MCGICGVYSADPAQRHAQLLTQMSEQLRHRGPDGGGSYHAGYVALGHRRLAIIDLQTGDQPLGNEDGTVQVILNGEIYNYRSLRRELEVAGHHFRTQSDTEVLAHGYEQWGVALPLKLNGMFAMAIWDARSERLLLARDHHGKKPLYYSYKDGTLVFASELKALLAHPSVTRRINRVALPAYLTYGYVPAPQTWYQDISQLLPGELLLLEGHGQPQLRQWWDVGAAYRAPRLQIGEREAAQELRRLVRAAVERRLIADVPLGAFLSGGLDSSVVVAEMAALCERPVETFSIGLSGGGWFDESPYAAIVAGHVGSKHHPFMVAPDAASLLPTLVRHYDEPFADSSALPTYLLSQLTRQHVTVALSGDGGDELFAGYQRFGAGLWGGRYQRLPRALRLLPELLSLALPRRRPASLPARTRRILEKLALPLDEGFPRWLTIFTPYDRRALLGAERPVSPDPAARFRQRAGEVASSGTLAQLLYYNLTTYLPDDLLVKADRMSMAHGLEVRSPLLDADLSSFVARLPARYLWRGWRGKWLLREGYRGQLPKQILDRSKHGFGIPLDRWFRQELRPLLHEALLSPDARIGHWLDRGAVMRLCAEHWQGQRDLGHQLWALLTLELWLDML